MCALSPTLSLSLLSFFLIRRHAHSSVCAHSRTRGSSASIIITFGKYVFVVTPEVSHPRKGKRGQDAPPSSTWGWLLRGWDTRGRFFATRFSALARRGVPERKRTIRKRGAQSTIRIRIPRAEDSRARSRV